MTVLSSGTDNIVAQSGVTIATPDVSFTPVATVTYANQSVTYNQISSSSSDAIIQTTTQYFTVSESTSSTQSPNLTCSLSGSTLITYSLSSYNSTVIPSFVSINSTTGILTIEAPIVSNSTFNSFCIDSTISGVSGTFQETINLIVKPCTVSNCKMCTVTNSSVCATCNSGFSVSSGS